MVVGLEAVRLGVLADTHMPHRLPGLPSGVVEVFADAAVDLILHAGDVDDPRFLEPLSYLAPVIAVQGNFHPQDFSLSHAGLPSHANLILCGRRLVLIHGHRPGLIGFWRRVIAFAALRLGLLARERINHHIARWLGRRFPWADVIVFGHTHQPFQAQINDTFFFNPGAVWQEDNLVPSVGLLTLGCERLETQIVPLTLEKG